MSDATSTGVRPHPVQEGEDLRTIAARRACTVDDIKKEPKNENVWKKKDAQGNVVETAYWVVPGDVVYVPDRPPPSLPMKLEDATAFRGKADLRTVRIKLFMPAQRNRDGSLAPGRPAPIGTEYRLTVGSAVTTGQLTEEGLIRTPKVPRSLPLTVEWVSLPTITYREPSIQYTNTPSSEVAQSRTAFISPGRRGAMRTEAFDPIDPATIAAGSDDRLCSARAHDQHPHHYLAATVERLRTRYARAAGTTSADASAKWDNRFFAAHPLAARDLPIPQAVQSQDLPRQYLYRSSPPYITDKTDPSTMDAIAQTGEVWYNKVGFDTHLLGWDSSPLAATVDVKKAYWKGDSNPQLAFATFATVANKRLVKLWMSDLKFLCGSSGAGSWLNPWFETGAAREHFQNWCQLVDRIEHHRNDRGPHSTDLAIDIDGLFNPWAPVWAPSQKQMIGETDRGTERAKECGRIYDRALRLFLQNCDLSPTAIANAYYQNAWNWTPQNLHEIYRNYQVLNWSLICYFHLLSDRLQQPKKRGVMDPTCNLRALIPQKPDDQEKFYRTLAGQLLDGTQKFVFPLDGELILEQKVVPQGGLGNAFVEDTIVYPDRHSATVWRAKIRAIRSTPASNEVALGKALAAQIIQDHVTLSSIIMRDACRGVFNLSYEVVMAFGRILDSQRDYDSLRMLGFNHSNAGDFMHLDFGYGSRMIDHLEIQLDGVAVNALKLVVDGKPRSVKAVYTTYDRSVAPPTEKKKPVYARLRPIGTSGDNTVFTCSQAPAQEFVLKGLKPGAGSLAFAYDIPETDNEFSSATLEIDVVGK